MSSSAQKLELRSVSVTFHGARGVTPALQELAFSVAPGEFLCLLGPSGCGKTTCLNLIAGLEKPDSGEVLIDGKPVTGPGRDRVLIFQEAALFPWLNVRDNVAFGLSARGMWRAKRLKIARNYLQMVHLEGFERSYPHELSGGMKQRVALARALALDPDVLLMDEPFAALDALTREQLHLELQNLWAETKKTIVFVTHNVREALVLGERVLLFTVAPGRVKSTYTCNLTRPRHVDDEGLAKSTHEILSELREEVRIAQEEGRHARMAS